MRSTLTTACAILGPGGSGALALAAVSLMSAGCGRSESPQRIPLHGTVRVEGALVTAGAITLLPTQGNAGPAASTAVVGGRYAFSEANGPAAGAHRVVLGVVAIDEAGAGRDEEVAADPRQEVGAAVKSAPAADAGPGGAAGAGDAAANAAQLEMRLDVPPQGDFRADLDFDALSGASAGADRGRTGHR